MAGTTINAGDISRATVLAAYPRWSGSLMTYRFYTQQSFHQESFYDGISVPYRDAVTGATPLYRDVFAPLNDAEQTAVLSALRSIETFTSLTFVPATTGQSSVLGFGTFIDSYRSTAPAWASPGSQNATGTKKGDSWLGYDTRIVPNESGTTSQTIPGGVANDLWLGSRALEVAPI